MFIQAINTSQIFESQFLNYWFGKYIPHLSFGNYPHAECLDIGGKYAKEYSIFMELSKQAEDICK